MASTIESAAQVGRMRWKRLIPVAIVVYIREAEQEALAAAKRA